MTRGQWTDDFLTRYRQIGDPTGDDVIRTIFARQDIRALDGFMRQLVANDAIPPNLPPEIQAFLEATSVLPPWADIARIRAAAQLFNIYGLVSLASLVCASLPECYTMRIGVRILDLTNQLGGHTNRRLHQTAAMVLAVMGPHGLEPDGYGLRQTQKVRLIHAAIRYRILSALGAEGVPAIAAAEVPVLIDGAVRSVNDVIAKRTFDWQLARDGWPINQEDLAFTLLTFGHVIPQAMRTFGVKLTNAEYEAFLHAWNVTGYILGVDEALMAHTLDEAEDLFARIKARQAGPSAAAARLTDSLLQVVEKDILRVPILRPLGPVLVRMLVGNPTAAMLGLDVRHGALVSTFHRIVAITLRSIQMAISPLAQVFQPMAPLSAKLGKRVVDHLCSVTDDGKVRQVEIPAGWR
jgi:hypothetical protein